MKLFLCICFSFFLLDVSFAAVTVKVLDIHDGDTITVKQRSKKPYKVRLYGIDAPELSQRFGESSRRNLIKLLKADVITLQSKGADTYGRAVAIVYADEKNVNEMQVRNGYAWHYKAYSKSRDLAYAEVDAKKARKGLWSDNNPTPPWEFRKKNKGASNDAIFNSVIKGVSICLDGKTDKIYLKSGKCPKGSIAIME